jgi:GT2 family glycosyltransferase
LTEHSFITRGERGLPSITVMITARDRPLDLDTTLRKLREQTYPRIEVIVVDDASKTSLESVTRNIWPNALFIRNEECQGYIANRSRAMRLATSEFVVSLDDDSCFTHPQDLSRAVDRMQAEPQIGVLTFGIYAGPAPVPKWQSNQSERYVGSFIGCGHMIRSQVISRIGGYRDFYHYYAEESEYSIRVWNDGWRILFFPSVQVHHRISSIGRRESRILRYSMRNNLWTTLLHMPLPRVAIQFAWRLISYTAESIRLFKPQAWIWGMSTFLWGLPRVIRMRSPIRRETLVVLDAISVDVINKPEQILRISRPGFGRLLLAFCQAWKNRPRSRSFWDRRRGGLGQSPTVVFEHNVKAVSEVGSRRSLSSQ